MQYFHPLDTPTPVSQSLSVLLGLKIRKLRMDRHLSQEEFAGLVEFIVLTLAKLNEPKKTLPSKTWKKSAFRSVSSRRNYSTSPTSFDFAVKFS